jgi:hypothetical protein
MKPTTLLTISAALMLALASCKKEDSAPGPMADNNSPSPAARSFNVDMTDSPADYSALNVQITGVKAYRDDAGWVDMGAQAQIVNIISLNNGIHTSLVTNANATPGHYSKLKLIFGDANTVTLNAGAHCGEASLGDTSTVALQFSGSHEVEVLIDQTVSETSGAQMMLDFDAAASVSQMGTSYVLHPVIHEMASMMNTGVKGTVVGALASTAEITNGEHVYGAYANGSGDFLIQGTSDGTYTLIINAIKKHDGVIYHKIVTVHDVTVTRGRITNVGNIET